MPKLTSTPYLAARTIENPDFAHRVRRLGLERQVAELAEQGYTVIERKPGYYRNGETGLVMAREVSTSSETR